MPTAAPPHRSKDVATDIAVWCGRGGGAVFVVGAIVVATTGSLVLEASVRGALYASAAAARVIGIVGLVAPWGRWPRTALMTVPGAGLLVMAVGGLLSPEPVFPPYISFFMIIFVYVGVTQSVRWCLAFVPISIVTFAVQTATHASALLWIHFAVVLPVALAVGVTISILVELVRTKSAQISQLLAATRAVTATRSATETVAVLEEELRGLLGADHVVVFLADHVGSHRYSNTSSASTEVPTTSFDLPEGAGLDAGAFIQRFKELTSVRATTFIAFPGEGGRLGGVCIGWTEGRHRKLSAANDFADVLTVEAGLELERQRATEQAMIEAATDPLTGLLNRRAIEARFSRLEAGDAVVMLDLDHFKEINDSRGHAAGDRVLRSFADTISTSARDKDWYGRLGGDEFVVVFRGAGFAGSAIAMKRLRGGWGDAGVHTGFSAGVAVHEEGDATHTLARADAALYEAKRRGRNRTEFHHPDPDVAAVTVAVD